MDLVPGVMVGGQYRLERKIAEGGMGEVWIGVHQGGARVAVKRLLADAVRDREIVTRFRREALLLGKIRSDHVSKVVEQIDDPTYGSLLVMEYVEGELLSDVLDKRKRLDVEEVIALGVDLARAVADLHKASIVHRDIKPENVILRHLPSGERRAVLIDFGLARLLDGGEGKRAGEETLTGITRADTGVGTIAYMAPEQILSSRDVSRAADVYALGAILYRAATGHNVFGDLDDMAYARRKLNDEAPPLDLERKDPAARGLADVVMRAVKRRPVERYEGVDPMLNDLVKARGLSRSDVDAPTQHVPVSSLIGAAGIAQTDAGPALAATLLPGMTTAAGPASVRVAPAPAPAPALAPAPAPMRPQPAHTMPILPNAPITSPAPPVAPPFGRPPFGSVPSVVTGVTPMHAPQAVAPGPTGNAMPKQMAIAGMVIALVVGFGLGFVLHAALADAPQCPPAVVSSPAGR